jgi:hypothetical protein
VEIGQVSGFSRVAEAYRSINRINGYDLFSYIMICFESSYEGYVEYNKESDDHTRRKHEFCFGVLIW